MSDMWRSLVKKAGSLVKSKKKNSPPNLPIPLLDSISLGSTPNSPPPNTPSSPSATAMPSPTDSPRRMSICISTLQHPQDYTSSPSPTATPSPIGSPRRMSICISTLHHPQQYDSHPTFLGRSFSQNSNCSNPAHPLSASSSQRYSYPPLIGSSSSIPSSSHSQVRNARTGEKGQRHLKIAAKHARSRGESPPRATTRSSVCGGREDKGKKTKSLEKRSKGQFICRYQDCGAVLYTRQEMKFHMDRKHKLRELPWKHRRYCAYCMRDNINTDNYFGTMFDLERHIQEADHRGIVRLAEREERGIEGPEEDEYWMPADGSWEDYMAKMIGRWVRQCEMEMQQQQQQPYCRKPIDGGGALESEDSDDNDSGLEDDCEAEQSGSED